MKVVDMKEKWVGGIPDSLTIPCSCCGNIPKFDYHVKSDVWEKLVPVRERTGVICLPCLNIKAKKVGIQLLDVLTDVFFCDGLGETIHLVPATSYQYTPTEDIE